MRVRQCVSIFSVITFATHIAQQSSQHALETTFLCNAFILGRGAVLNSRGFVENEAAVMDGATLTTGAVTGCTSYITPGRSFLPFPLRYSSNCCDLLTDHQKLQYEQLFIQRVSPPSSMPPPIFSFSALRPQSATLKSTPVSSSAVNPHGLSPIAEN